MSGGKEMEYWRLQIAYAEKLAREKPTRARNPGGPGKTITRPGKTPVAPSSKPAPSEHQIQAAILKLLAVHPRVAWSARMNSGAYSVGQGRERRFIRFGFPGCPDVIGQLKGGRFLAVECKRAGGKPTAQQREFLETVNRHGGLGLVADNPDAVRAALENA